MTRKISLLALLGILLCIISSLPNHPLLLCHATTIDNIDNIDNNNNNDNDNNNDNFFFTTGGGARATLTPHPTMYQISTRPWLYELSQKYKKSITQLNQVPLDEFTSLKKKGIDMIWLMGVWKLGVYSWARATELDMRKNAYVPHLPDYQFSDIIGSPYAVVDYVVNPEIGTDQDLISLKQKLNSIGLRLMVDFVPNHSAVDAHWVTAQPELYVLAPKNVSMPYDPSEYLPNGVAMGRDPYFAPWSDTAQWNYWNVKTRELNQQLLLKVASMSDAIRCDMAMLLLNDVISQVWGKQLASHGYVRPSTEWWSDAIRAVKAKYPTVQFLAEVYWGLDSKLQSLGFDFTYDKELYDKLKSGDVRDIKTYISSLGYDRLSHGAKFVENHDEERAMECFGSAQRSTAAALVSMTLPGLRFHFMGQWEGKANRLVVQLRRSKSENVVASVVQFYDRFVPIVSHPVFHTGQWTYLTVHNPGSSNELMAWKWTDESTNERRLVVVNYNGGGQGSGQVVLPDAKPTLPDGVSCVFKDLLTGQDYQRNVNEVRTSGLVVVLGPFSAHIFQY